VYYTPQKKKEVMKKQLWILTLLLFGAALITLRIIAYDKPESILTIKENTASREIDRLFRNMEIIKVPRISPPVDFSLLDLYGKKVILSDFKGKIVFLNFWATWCPSCREEMPSMQKLYTRFKDKDFAVVAVSMNEPASVVKKFFKDYNLTFTSLLDSEGETGARFGVRAIPMTFILGRNGGIIGKAFGPRKWNSKKSMALFEYVIKNTVRNANIDEHQQKKNISSHSVKPGTGTGNTAVN
jgi:peroxiredoxin